MGYPMALRLLHSTRQPQSPSPAVATEPLTPPLTWPPELLQTLGKKILPANYPIVPDPIPLVPDVATLLMIIGRGMDKHSAKIETWEALFTLNTNEFIELGVNPPRDRKYLIKWLHRFRLRQYGPAGDLKYVEHGKARLCVWTDCIRDKRRVINVPFRADPLKIPESELCFPKDYWVSGSYSIKGPLALRDKRVAHDEAIVTVRPGMWEHKRGLKIDGGERRRKSVRFQKLAAQRKLLREERLGRGQF